MDVSNNINSPSGARPADPSMRTEGRFSVLDKPRWFGYLLAVTTTALALAVRLSFNPVLENRSLLLIFVIPVLISAWYGGLVPGLLATALSVLAAIYFFVAPYNMFAVELAADFLQLAIFITAASMISLLCHSLRLAKRHAEYDARALQESSARLRERAAQQEAVASIGLFALEGQDLPAIMQKAVERVHKVLEVDFTAVFKLMPQDDEFLLVAGCGWDERLTGSTRISGAQTHAGYTVRTSEPVVVRNYLHDERFRRSSFLEEQRVVSGVGVVIRGQTGPYGTLAVYTTRERAFSQDDINFLQAVANVLGEGVRQQHVEEELERARDHLEEQVEERTSELKSLNEELESFNYSVAHDLRAPLRGIAGFSRVLLEDYGNVLDETAKRYLIRIQMGGERMGNLIDNLLELSRLSRENLVPRQANLTELAHEVAEQLLAQDPKRSVEFRIAEGIEAEADARLVMVVLENLFENAWKFTRDRHPAVIEFGALRQDDQVVCYLKDNGAGFDMTYANKLFVPFQRLHADEFEGTGIGLATVQRIIERHGGRIWAEGEEGKGATFFFTLEAKAESV